MSFSSSPRRVAARLAEAWVAGPWREADLVDRGSRLLGRRRRWIPSLASRVLSRFGTGGRPTAGRVAAFVLADAGFLRASERGAIAPAWVGPPALPAVMWPAPGGPEGWAVPPLTTPGELAACLGLGLSELEWLADLQGRARRSAAGGARRYAYRWVAKRSTGARLVEVPMPRLRIIQGRMLRTILEPIPPHPAAHGFRRGRSVRSFAGPHAGRAVVLRLDLRDFFPTITAARVTAVFLAAGYPEAVARRLAALATNGAPPTVWSLPGAPGASAEPWGARLRLRDPHLPQGAPTSPALANLCAYRLDCRLAGLAASAGASYTRYADDLAFSGDEGFARSVGRFRAHAGAIALEEGFALNARKTRIMGRGGRQRVAGLVVNERPNCPRGEYDALKAILHNCLVHGPAGQDRRGEGVGDFRAHLGGRVAWVASIHAARGARLRAAFEAIAW